MGGRRLLWVGRVLGGWRRGRRVSWGAGARAAGLNGGTKASSGTLEGGPKLNQITVTGREARRVTEQAEKPNSNRKAA